MISRQALKLNREGTNKGGLPIMIEGRGVGGVGVSGGTGDQDAEVAKAGIDALTAA